MGVFKLPSPTCRVGQQKVLQRVVVLLVCRQGVQGKGLCSLLRCHLPSCWWPQHDTVCTLCLHERHIPLKLNWSIYEPA